MYAEHLRGYYFNKTSNKYFKIESTSTTTARPFRLYHHLSSTTTTESTKRNDDLKKLTAAGQPVSVVQHSTSSAVSVSSSPLSNVQLIGGPLGGDLHNKSKVSATSNPDQELDSIERPKINMLDFFSGMSKAIHLLLYQRDPSKGGLEAQESVIREDNQTASTTREPISIFRPLKVNSKIPPEGLPSDYRAQAELLRQQILRRCNQLQNIIATTNEILRERENHMFAKILDNFSTRIEHTKLRADLILKEPATSTAAVKALNRINYGLNNMNHLVQNVLSRVNVSINLDMKESNQKDARREAKRIKESKSSKKEPKKETEKVPQ